MVFGRENEVWNPSHLFVLLMLLFAAENYCCLSQEAKCFEYCFIQILTVVSDLGELLMCVIIIDVCKGRNTHNKVKLLQRFLLILSPGVRG